MRKFEHDELMEITWHCADCGRTFSAPAGKNPEQFSRPARKTSNEKDDSLLSRIIKLIGNSNRPECVSCSSNNTYNDWDVRGK